MEHFWNIYWFDNGKNELFYLGKHNMISNNKGMHNELVACLYLTETEVCVCFKSKQQGHLRLEFLSAGLGHKD